MYPYHNIIKHRIKAGELQGYYYDPNRKKFGPALVLVFNTAPIERPIRPHRWAEYLPLLEGYICGN